MKRLRLLLLFSITFWISLSAQLTPQEAIEGMGRGINLGNTLEPPFEGSWNNGPAQESYFDAYVEAGFTNIRIPVRWDKHTGNSAPYMVNAQWMNRVEEVVDWGLERGFYITLNGHHEDWLKNGYSDANLRARYDAIWTQIAERFKDKSERLLFEVINEPLGMSVAQVDELNARILGIIRQNNPTRIVIFGGNVWSNAEQLFTAAIPDDEYLIGYYHSYDPWQFSGEGQGTWGTANDYQQITNKYNAVKNWSTTNDIPVHHSEFGAVHACDYNSRMRIYAHNVEQCIINGIAFSVWDDGGNFGILDRSNNSWPEVKDILVHYHPDSPNAISASLTSISPSNTPAVKVQWNNRATDNIGWTIERSLAGTSNFDVIGSVPPSADTYTDTNIEPGNTYTYRIYTKRADGTLLHGYPTRIRITATTQSPYNEPIKIPGIIEVEEYDKGGQGLAYNDSEEANIPGGFRTDEGVDIGAYGSGYILEYVASGEWIEYTVDVSQKGTYSVSAEVASEVANGRFSLTFDKNDASTTFLVPSTGGWTDFQSVDADLLIELEAGQQIMRLDITNGNPFNVDDLTITLEMPSSTYYDDITMLNLSPNPSNGLINIKLDKSLPLNDLKLELIDLHGRVVDVLEISKYNFNYDVSLNNSGIYTIKLSGSDVAIARKVVIAK